MKYIKASSDIVKDLSRIAGEIINYAYGFTYYIDGKFQDEPKPKHNAYLIDGIEFDIHPNISIVYLNTDDLTFREALGRKIGEFDAAVQMKFGGIPISLGIPGSTQYLMMEDVRTTRTDILGRIGLVTTDNFVNWNGNLPTGYLFLVYLIGKSGCTHNLPIPGINAKKFPMELNLMSLSAIIYDSDNLLNLPDGNTSPDFPSIENYSVYSNGKILKEFIYYDIHLGLLRDIVNCYNNKDLSSKKKKEIDHIFKPIKDRMLLWAKWEWLKIHKSQNVDIPWNEQIIKGLLDVDEETLEDESLAEYEKKTKDLDRYSCFITGIPIYEDCYAFDVYERVVREYVPRDEVCKYPDAVIITEEELELELEKNKQLKEKAAAEKKKSLAAKKAEQQRRKREIERNRRRWGGDNSDEESDEEKTTVLASQLENKTKESIEKIEKVEKAIKTVKKETVIKRGTKKPVSEIVLIERTIKHTTPKCVLISPYYIHCTPEIDPVAAFEKATNSKVQLYRTFCPITLNTVISELPTSQLHKDVLADLNVGVEIKTYTSRESAKVRLLKEIPTTDFSHITSTSKILARFVS